MRAFIAIELGDEVRKRLREFQQELDFKGVKLVESTNLHITLFFLGEIDEQKQARVVSAMENISAGKFELSCKGVGVFPNPNFIRVVWAGCESPQVGEIYGQLAGEIRRLGYELEPFHPHVTVARVKDPRTKEKVLEALAKFKGADFGRCMVERVVLMKSTLTPKGPVYEVVHAKWLT